MAANDTSWELIDIQELLEKCLTPQDAEDFSNYDDRSQCKCQSTPFQIIQGGYPSPDSTDSSTKSSPEQEMTPESPEGVGFDSSGAFPSSESTAKGGLSTTTVSHGTSSSGNRSKRNLQQAFGDQNERISDDEYNTGKVRRRSENGDEEVSAGFFACPYYKHDQNKYVSCLGYELKRIKDVKQHISRKHCQPEFYCSRCFQVFSSANSRDSHTRSATCRVQINPNWDGVTPEQKRRLTKFNRGQSLESQWYDIWELIFGRDEKPRSVYVGSYIKEVMPMIRWFWEMNGSEIVSTVCGKHVIEPNTQVFQNIMSSILSQFEQEATRNLAGLNGKNNSQDGQRRGASRAALPESVASGMATREQHRAITEASHLENTDFGPLEEFDLEAAGLGSIFSDTWNVFSPTFDFQTTASERTFLSQETFGLMDDFCSELPDSIIEFGN